MYILTLCSVIGRSDHHPFCSPLLQGLHPMTLLSTTLVHATFFSTTNSVLVSPVLCMCPTFSYLIWFDHFLFVLAISLEDISEHIDYLIWP